MPTDSSSLRVTQHLRRLASAAAPGMRLPSVRALMDELGVSPVTVQKAMAQLAAEGLLEARPGRGTFVAPRAQPPAAADYTWQSAALGVARTRAPQLVSLLAAPGPGVISLSTGYLPEDLQPVAALVAAAQRAARRPGVWHREASTGLEPLRRWFAQEGGAGYEAHETIICPGTQGALSAAFRALAGAGDAVVLESPTYLGAIAAAQAAQLRIFPVPVDAEGVRPELLEEVLQRSGARLFYCQPAHANPSGAVLGEARRAQVLEVAARAHAFVIEDDWARDLALGASPPPPPLAKLDRRGQVVYVRSLTKAAAPSLRVGALCARGAAFERLSAARIVDDLYVSALLQEIALQLVTSPAWPRHLRQLRRGLLERRDALAAAVISELGAAALPQRPSGGLHLWVRLPDGIAEEPLTHAAAAAGVLVTPGRIWFPAEPTGEYLRLSFAGEAPGALASGVARLARCLGELGSAAGAAPRARAPASARHGRRP
jgi:DNA-binding transcriptional MocR family regulator